MKLKSNARGSILISSLWILVILTVMSIGIAFRARLMIKLTEQYTGNVKRQHCAISGYYQAIQILQKDETAEYDSLKDPWADNAKEFENKETSSGKYSVFYRPAVNKTVFGILDEEQKINLNTANFDILSRLPGFSDELANCLIDWRDKDSLESPDGAENDYYEDKELPYKCKNAPIECLEELLMIKDFSEDTVEKIRPYVTVYGSGSVNINTASREVLLILGLDEELVDIIIEYRAGIDGISGSHDDGIFESTNNIVNAISEFEPINPDDSAALQNLISNNLLTVKSTCFTVYSHGYTKSPAQSVIVSATVSISKEGSLELKRWQVKR